MPVEATGDLGSPAPSGLRGARVRGDRVRTGRRQAPARVGGAWEVGVGLWLRLALLGGGGAAVKS